ncbi:MAG: hypothetical protein AAGC46_04875 [Solirubrobacteraceae bacterium]|nr:hypothetical protein [Patulibacter sp.]
MKFFQDILHDLVEKKLWPFAAGLVVMIVVAGMMLSKPGDATVAASAPAATTSTDVGPELSLTRTSTTGFARAPRVNDKETDPFGISNAKYVAYIKTLKAALASVDNGGGSSTTDTTVGGVDVTSGGQTPTNNGGTTDTTGGQTPSNNTPSGTTPVKTVKDTVISVLVTQSDDSDPKELTDVRTLSPLPDADNPFLVYVGKTSDGKASFIVASNAVPTGDGTCSPSPTDCSTLTLAPGDTEKFAVTVTDTTVNPPATTVQNLSVTLEDITTKKVPVDDGTDETAAAARYEARARATGAKAVRSAITINTDVGTALMREGVTIGR